MSLFNYCNSHYNDVDYRSGDFVLSSVNSSLLSKYNINMKVKDFKALVKKSNKFKIVITGGCQNFRKTKVYNFKDFI